MMLAVVSLLLLSAPVEAFTASTSRIHQLTKVKTRQVSCNSSSSNNNNNNNNSNNNRNNNSNPVFPIADIGSNLLEKFPLSFYGQQKGGTSREEEIEEDAYTAQQRRTKEVLSSLGITMKEPEVAYVEKDNSFDIATSSLPVSKIYVPYSHGSF